MATETVERLTFDDIKHDFTTCYGWQVAPLGEDCDALLIVGHLEPMHAAGVARWLTRSERGEQLSEVANVRQRHGVFRRPTAEDMEGWEFEVNWFVHFEDEPVEGSVPVTTLDIEVW